MSQTPFTTGLRPICHRAIRLILPSANIIRLPPLCARLFVPGTLLQSQNVFTGLRHSGLNLLSPIQTPAITLTVTAAAVELPTRHQWPSTSHGMDPPSLVREGIHPMQAHLYQLFPSQLSRTQRHPAVPHRRRTPLIEGVTP